MAQVSICSNWLQAEAMIAGFAVSFLSCFLITSLFNQTRILLLIFSLSASYHFKILICLHVNNWDTSIIIDDHLLDWKIENRLRKRDI